MKRAVVILALGAAPTAGIHSVSLAAPSINRSAADAELAAAAKIEAYISRGALQRAQRLLDNGDFSELVRATLEGRLALAQGHPAQAEKRFRAAMALAPDHAPLRVLVAHSLVAQQEFSGALSVLDHPKIRANESGIALLRATAYEGLGDNASAYDALVAAASESNDSIAIRQRLVLAAAQHQHFETARAWAKTLTPKQLGADLAVLVLQTLRGQPGSLALAQWLAAGFPDSASIQGELSWIYSAAGNHRAAARGFARACALGAPLAFEAAEHYRVAGAYRSALAMNAQVTDPNRRIPQRFDIVFESGAMAKAIVIAQGLAKVGGVSAWRRYNVAYAHFTLRQYAAATRLARTLEGTDEADRAAVLLQAMGRESWSSGH